MFQTVSPESIGIPSQKVLEFFRALEPYHLNTHSVIMARGNQIFAETYYAPFDEHFLHRMYSVSKSYTAIAVGLAEQEGLLSLDDKLMRFFPEYRNEKTDDLYGETTIRDLLTMRTCSAHQYPDYWGKPDRVSSYFDMVSNQVPGTNYFYDSAGAFLLTCIVEKLTGKPFMEYLKEKFLQEIGFSENAYCLLAPGGHSHGDSGVMCTSRDLLTFARFVMNGGVWNGKRYINEEFMKAAVAKQTDNYRTGGMTDYSTHGYGYLIWKTPRDGFAFLGMADQLAICDPKTDSIFIITSENMAAGGSRQLIYHELYKTIIECLGEPLPENPVAYGALKSYLATRKMVTLTGGEENTVAEKINGKTYTLRPNRMGLETVKVTIQDGKGELEYRNGDGINRLRFGMGYNEFGQFPGKMRVGLTASVYEPGNYACGASAIWSEEAKLHILVRIVDTYMGTLSIVLGFRDNQISVSMERHAQRILDGLHGSAAGSCNP